MKACIDALTVVLGAVVVRGWCEGDPPDIVYGDEVLKTTATRTRRADLIPFYGREAKRWGFVCAATPPADLVEHDKIRLQLGDRRLSVGEVVSPYAAGGNRPLERFLALLHAAPGPLLEIGSRARSGTTYRSMFPAEAPYLGLDIAPGPNVDVVGDAHRLTKDLSDRFDYVFSVSVFEHLLMPWKAAIEMNGIMRDGAHAYIQSHQGWPLHEEPWDFFRFSANAWAGLFNRQTGFEVVEAGYALPGMIVPLFAVGGPTQGLDEQRTQLLSSCLVRKVGEPSVAWSGDPAEIYDLAYDHGDTRQA